MQKIQQHAAFLCSFTGDSVAVSDMVSFLQRTERPKDIVDACNADRSLGHVFATVYETHETCFRATSLAHTAEHLQDFCFKVLNALGHTGTLPSLLPESSSVCHLELHPERKRAGATCTVNGSELAQLHAVQTHVKIASSTSQGLLRAFNDTIALLNEFINQGWFLHLAFMEDVKGRFDALHNTVVRLLEAEGASGLPGGKHLLPGDYKDPTRALRRCDPSLLMSASCL